MTSTYISAYLETETILSKNNITIPNIEEWVNSYSTFNTKVKEIGSIEELDTFIMKNKGYNREVIAVEEGKKVCRVNFLIGVANATKVTLYIYLFKNGRIVLELGNTISCYKYGSDIPYENISINCLEDTLYKAKVNSSSEEVEEVEEIKSSSCSKAKVILPKSFSNKLSM